MESRESRGYECDDYGFTPSSNESRESRPSRGYECDDYGFTPSSNESRESRGISNYDSYKKSGLDLLLTPNGSESRKDKKESDKISPTQYNDLEEIDSLITRLSDSLEEDRPINRRINNALDKRKTQIQQLKELREEMLMNKKLEEEAKSLEKENDEIDKTIKMLKRKFRK